MNNIIKLVAKDSVSINGREFTRVMGGFNENGIVITDKQIGDLLGYAKGSRQVRVQINNNISHFTDNDLKDVLHMDNNSEILKTLGYTNMQTSKAENIYILSQAGFLLYLKVDRRNPL